MAHWLAGMLSVHYLSPGLIHGLVGVKFSVWPLAHYFHSGRGVCVRAHLWGFWYRCMVHPLKRIDRQEDSHTSSTHSPFARSSVRSGGSAEFQVDAVEWKRVIYKNTLLTSDLSLLRIMSHTQVCISILVGTKKRISIQYSIFTNPNSNKIPTDIYRFTDYYQPIWTFYRYICIGW